MPSEQPHQLPRPIPRQGRKDLFAPNLLAKIPESPAMTRIRAEVLQALQELEERREILRSGKGCWLVETPSAFDVPNLWVDGYLGLRVDAQHHDVRRLGWPATVTFKPNSKEWQIFRMAWEAGAQGCSTADWNRLEWELEIVGISKSHRQSVSNKLAVIGLRLACRCPPRLIEIEKSTR